LRSVKAGLAILALAAISMLPTVRESIAQLPIYTALLGLTGLYLLCFRR